MKPGHNVVLFGALMVAVWFLVTSGLLAESSKKTPEPMLLVVMDPLAKELACACVKGYGQRDYRKLASRLEAALKQRVAIEFSDDLAESLAELKAGGEVLVVGAQSLVANGAKKAGLKCHPACELTDQDGNVTLGASFIARSDDLAKELKDIASRQVLFGLGEADEKYAAAMASLRVAGIERFVKMELRPSYSDAALDMLDSPLTPPPVAVIPSYALPLLEGCGSVKPGSLKVIGKTQPVPFITCFIANAIPSEKQEAILKTLLGLKDDAKLLKALESRDGFKPVKPRETSAPKTAAETYWPDWRGPNRDGHVPRLPARLSPAAKFIWKKAAMIGGLAGLSVGREGVILAERDFDEAHDVYRCLDAATGELVWRAAFSARGKLDYGQSPRATPVMHAGKAYLLGAFGGLRCVNLTNGSLIWERDLPREFNSRLPTWGMCSTPLIVDDLLIVNPGGTNASLAALDCLTGRTRWTTPGLPAAYSAFICGEFGGVRQLVGYDQYSLGGWDVRTGKRLWTMIPRGEGDFNVPTPVAVDEGLIVSTENNGTRFHLFDRSGRICSKAAAEFADLSPSTASPVVTCGRVFGAHLGLHCLDLKKGLKSVWHLQEEALDDHVTFIADDARVLVITLGGELILLDAKADTCAIISRLRLFEDDVEVYSHPGLVGTRLYARGGSSVVCVDLGTD